LKTALIKLLKNMNYVLYATASFVAYFGLFLPATFLPDLMYEADRSSTEVYIIVMVLGATDFCGRLLFGAISHKVTKLIPFVHSFGLLLFSIGTALLTLASSFISFIALAAVLGLGAGK
jgi:predicted MFS family arabinose efflux permease